MKLKNNFLLLLASFSILGACGATTDPAEVPSESLESVASDTTTVREAESVTVELINRDGEAIGEALLTEEQDQVILTITARDLPPGELGFHIHENGIVEPPTFESAGSHFNPTDVEHGENSGAGPHLGDMPNLLVEEDGTVEAEFILTGVSLNPDVENSLAHESGTSLVIHSEADDYESQPSGDAGERIAAGVIFEPQN